MGLKGKLDRLEKQASEPQWEPVSGEEFAAILASMPPDPPTLMGLAREAVANHPHDDEAAEREVMQRLRRMVEIDDQRRARERKKRKG